MDKILDRILKILQIISITIGGYMAYLGATHKTYVMNKGLGYGVISIPNPVLTWIIVGVCLVAVGAFFIGRTWRK